MDFLIITCGAVSNVWCLHQRKKKDNDDLQTEFAPQQTLYELGVKLFIVPRTRMRLELKIKRSWDS